MSRPFALLKCVDPQGVEAQGVRQRLRRHGVEVRRIAPRAGPYLRFSLIRQGSGAMDCCLNANDWAARHLPGAAGLAWAHITAQDLAALIGASARPVTFPSEQLSYDEAAFQGLMDGPLHAATPCIESHEGSVWVDRFDWPAPRHAPIGELPGGLPVSIALRIGRAKLSRRQLARLRQGDIVLLTEAYPCATLRGTRLFSFELEPESIKVNDLLFSLDEDTNSSVQTDDAAIHHLDMIELTVEVVVGKLEKTVAELAQLQPGDVVALQDDAYKQMELRVDGRRFATGELVQIGDQLAVQVLKKTSS